MNKTPSETEMFLSQLSPRVEALKAEDIEVIVSPPFTSLYAASEILSGTSIKVSAQNVISSL